MGAAHRPLPRHDRQEPRLYDRFWGSIRSVQVSQVTSEAPSSVVATLRYDYDDGRTFVERTSYSLVRDGGQLKIDRSSVLSSRQT